MKLSSSNLEMIYANINDFENAYKYQKIYTAVKDSILNKESQTVKESIPEPKKIKREKVIYELPLEDVILIQ